MDRITSGFRRFLSDLARGPEERSSVRYKEAAREEVTATVSGERETEEEFRYLLRVLSG